MTLKEKKDTTTVLGAVATVLTSMASYKYSTEILIVGFTLTIAATYIVENLAKEK